MQEKQPIKYSDIKIIVDALINLINKFPELPPNIKKGGILFEQSKPQNISMCLSTIPSGSIIDKTYICGKYIGIYTFKLILQKMSVTNEQRIDAQDILGKIVVWLEKSPIEKADGEVYKLEEYPPLDETRTIQKIEQISNPRIVQRLEPNIEISEVNLRLKFEVEPKEFF